ncbi:ABC transporter permease [Adhaeribacter rhizoryzae]|uniref:ABC transporter permease n=1 Tax=Adhaeribacter rhizoryzae TaxID=2607907 RepID=A0A5M6DKU1_9BACT|nr:ABC transporter permease [Adhaeribacter rhizoryzae]KAA5548141.1 ABC transporter permease [Adhaeribacter rhizoryzae]
MAVTQAPVTVSRPPAYYIRLRLWRNKPAMLGLLFILAATVIAILGYLILPDATPNANNSFVALQKKTPGFAVQVLRVPVNTEAAPGVNIFYKMLFGQEDSYQEYPIRSYQVNGSWVIAQPYEQNKALPQEDLKFAISALTPPGTIPNTTKQLPGQVVYTKHFWLGTDNAGRDVLSRLLLGTRISLGIGLVAVLISVFVGIVIGAIAGYFGGFIDRLMQFLMTVVWSVPSIMLVIAISLALNSKGIWVSFVAVGLTMWVDVARVIRGQFLSLKEKTYIEAVRVLGLPRHRIILNHLLPNMTGPLIVIATANFASAILMEAGLSFLGLGVQPPAPSWGMMVSEGFQLIGAKAGFYLVLLPSVLISLLVLSFNLLGNGLRDAYDPKILLTNTPG